MLETGKYPIHTKNMSWSFNENIILDDINLTIEKGKIYSVIGPNGSGKTTLLRNLSKMLSPKKQSVFLEGNDLVGIKSKEIAKKMAYVQQNINIDFEFTVFDIVLMGRSPHLKRFETETDKDIEIVNRAMEATNTYKLRDKKINEISGGERQRVILSRALAQETDIMLLDEPTSQLDIQHQIEVLNTVRTLKNEKNKTIIMVLHDLNSAVQYSDYLILLNKGKIISIGTPGEIIQNKFLEEVYGVEFCTSQNPKNGKVYIFPVL